MSKGAAIALAAVAALAAGGAWWWWRSEQEGTDVEATQNALFATLPPKLGVYTPQIVAAAAATRPGGRTLLEWAAFVAAVLFREAFYPSGGWALRPADPSGTGDPSPRWRAGPPQWAIDLELVMDDGEGNPITRTSNGGTQYRIAPPTAGGAKVAGWGYGLGQHDWETGGVRAWIESGAYADPAQNIRRAADKLAGLYAKEGTGDLVAVAAAYNAGARALTADDPDALTTGGDYGSTVAGNARRWSGSGSAAA